MDRIRISGGRRLAGEVTIRGAKNAALPLMVAALLTEEPLILTNMPHLADIDTLAALLESHGVVVAPAASEPDSAGAATEPDERALSFTVPEITNTTAEYDLVRKMRASVLVLGPLVAREGRARVSLPGGCAIGSRPVDIHLDGLARLGAEIELRDGYIEASAPNGLTGGTVPLAFPSVGATENLLMAASLADGQSVIQNAAREPEVSDLARCLVSMGADIEGIGTSELTITGQPRLKGARHAVVADRIEAGTYAIAAAITGGDIELVGAVAEHLEAPLQLLEQVGATVSQTDRGFRISADQRAHAVDIATSTYPGFPTDLQAQAMALMTVAEGASVISETIFENRFMHVPELIRMGADITVRGGTAMVRGVERLRGAPVMATDLRASSSLVLAGLVADGETMISRVYHIDRGYERIEEKLAALGADIERVGT
ncbi:MAG: UDP-N-acetylglucosamine 1-carboxyvinyltransferase [Alphaproteobacteria bacterium]|jgi:UDP-N-acetylglucosamine 1-carboxyvinyltransferase|nr:UDP-N-acetylglucosamine 1-carboxyvinyltransferase [Alphaproteobacteria bacterium]